MADTVSKAERSRMMARVKSKDTAPEMIVRRLVHRLGYRYRLHVRHLPSTPDIVLPRHRKIVDVRGCFWHMHSCGRCRLPESRREWWITKLRRNVARDRAASTKLRRLGWEVLTLWECELHDPRILTDRLTSFLERPVRDPPVAARQKRAVSNR